MTLRAYQESPQGGNLYLLTLQGARRPSPYHGGGLRALCCWGSRSAGEGAAEVKSPCTSLAEPGVVQERPY
jgi:hypothetical protein